MRSNNYCSYREGLEGESLMGQSQKEELEGKIRKITIGRKIEDIIQKKDRLERIWKEYREKDRSESRWIEHREKIELKEDGQNTKKRQKRKKIEQKKRDQREQ